MSETRRPPAFSTIRKNLKTVLWSDLYHWVLKTTWPRFLFCIGFGYILISLVFASVLYFQDNPILNADPKSYWHLFLFCFQTSTTIGYGYFLPQTNWAHVVVIVETLCSVIYTPHT